MTMKRKRSDSEISFCSTSILSSPESNEMDIDMCISQMTRQPFRDQTPSHLSSRTRKRFRDNRPSEEIIHQNTLSLLFSAQTQPQIESLPNPTFSTNPRPAESTHQSSLHSFWSFPSHNSSASSSPSPPSFSAPVQTNCEDCDSNVFASDENSMDVDMVLCDTSVDFGCSTCRKIVCNRCSISNLGADRQCLICAGKRKPGDGLPSQSGAVLATSFKRCFG